MKVLASFSKPEEAHLLRAHLEGSGVTAFVRDDLTVSADWALSNAIGGVKVEVADEDYDEARSVLAAFAPPVADEKKQGKKHGLARYMRILAVSFAVIFCCLAWRGGLGGSPAFSMTLIPSFIVSGCIATFCAVLDL